MELIVKKRDNIVVCLEIGTDNIRAAMGEINYPEPINVLGIACVPSEGVRRGSIIDIENTSQVIERCLNDLEEKTGVEVNRSVLAFSNPTVMAMKNFAAVALARDEVKEEDQENVLKAAMKVSLPSDKSIVQTVLRQYILDGNDGIQDPLGMVGIRLEAEVLIIAASSAVIKNLQRSISIINLEISHFFYNPLLIAESVLVPAEQEMGVVLIDMGAGSTGITFFYQGGIQENAVLTVGSEYITKDLAIVLRTSLEEAKLIKETYGMADPEKASEHRTIPLRNIHGKEIQSVSQKIIAEIINARIVEMAEMIYSKLQEFNCLDKLPGGLVITGGGAQLEGITDFWEEYLEIPVRLGNPNNIHNVKPEYQQPQNAAILGGLLYTMKHHEYTNFKPDQELTGVFYRFYTWLKDAFR